MYHKYKYIYHKYKYIYHKYRYDHANQSYYTIPNTTFHTEDSTGWQVMLFHYHRSKDLREYHKYKDKQTKTGAIIHTDKYKYKIDKKKLFFNVT